MQGVSPGLGVLTTDRQLRVRSWNAWLAAASGLREAEVQGRPLLDVVRPEDREVVAEILGEVLATGSSRVLASAFHRYLIPCAPSVPSSHFDRMQQRVTVAVLGGDRGIAGLMITIDDVTGRRDAERALAATLEAGAASVEPSAIVAAVGAGDWRLRGAAVRALRQSATREEVAHLLESLERDHHQLDVLSSALQVLIAANRDVTAPLVQLLGDRSPNLRMHAALALGELNDAAAIPGLVRALDDEDANVRFHAIEALGRMRAPEAVEPLARIAESGDFFLSFPAIDALARIDDAGVVPSLLALLGHELLRPALIDALAALGDEDCVVPMMERLNAGEIDAAPVAAALERIHARYEGAFGAGLHIVELARLAATPEGIARLSAAVERRDRPLAPLVTVLGWMGPEGVGTLAGALGESSVETPLAAALARLGAAAVTPVIEHLMGGEHQSRLAAAVLLGRLGDRRAVEPLIEALAAADDGLTAAAAGSLASLGDPRALDALLALFAHQNASVRQAAIAAVNSIGAEATATRVRARLTDADPRVRECAIRVAAYFGFDGSTTGILAALGDEREEVRRAAIEQLPIVDDPRALPKLLAALRDETPRNRAAAAHALRSADGGDVEAALIAALADADPWVRYFAAGSLSIQGRHAAVAALARSAADDTATHVRIAAIHAVAALDPGGIADLVAAWTTADDDDLASAAVGALARARGERADALLEAAVHGHRATLRAAATQALAVRGSAQAPEILAWTARTPDSPALAASAIEALRHIAAAADAPGQTGALAALLELGADPLRREAAVVAMAALPPHVIGQLDVALSSPRTPIRLVLVEVLARMRHRQASEVLLRALADDQASMRAAVVAAFGRLGTPAAADALGALRQSDPDPAVRRKAAAVCQRHGWGSRSSEGRA